MTHTLTRTISSPKYTIGSIVASEKYAGTIVGAFYADGGWNYNIGQNADLEQPDGIEGHRIGQKFIRESNIKWQQQGRGWQEVENVYRG